MKILKPIAIAAVILLLVVAALLAYIATTFDAERIKQEAAQAMLAKFDRTLVINGNLKLKFWPSLGLDMEKVMLSEQGSQQPFASLQAAHVAVRAIPLLSKKIVVDALDIDGLHLTLVRDRNGHLNIDDLLGKKKPDGADTPPPEFDIAGIRVSNAQLTWRDERAQNSKEDSLVVSDLGFSTGHVSADKEGMSVHALKLSTKGKRGPDNIALILDIPDVVRKGEQISAPKIDIKADLDGAGRRGTASIELNDIQGTMLALKIGGLTLDLDAKLGDKTIKGKLATPLDLNLGTSTLLLPTIAGEFDIDMPGLPVHPLKLPINGKITTLYGKSAFSGNLATAFDETHAEVKFNIAGNDAQGAKRRIDIDVAVDKINVDKYLPPAPAKAAENSDGPIDLSALKGLNASGTVRVGELQIRNIKARNLRITFKAANGKLDIAPHSAELYGGRANGSASLNAAGNRIALNESLRGINVQPLIKDVVDKDMMEGKGDITLDIVTQGRTVGELKKSLAGSASAALRDGAIKGINLAQTLRSAKAKLGNDVSQQADASDKTDFSELSASFRIANGVARNDDLAAKSPFIRLGGNGDIDIGNGQLNYLLKASVVGTAAGQGGKELDALKGLTVPVRISGPFEKPAFKLELANLAGDAAKARIEDKKQEVQQKVQDKLKDKLKGLF